ncbi:amino acid permease [Wukongibacter baidiensis]|uniref:APC family permease n=1 Tax=Wukongibacter baidiensis TaxID=1723361 RepID=UPI003D7FB425
MKKKIGPLLLSGLMIGPILGSGIILLPPLAYGKLGNSAIWSWIVIMTLGAIFAMIFSKLSTMYPGDGGMTIAIEKSLGKKYKLYSSFLMISAVSFGPTAVMLTASDYLNNLKSLSGVNVNYIAMGLVLVSLFILLKDIKFISTLSFIFSSIITVIILISSIVVLSQNSISITPITDVQLMPLGKTVLLLFWAIIGWEIVGNYSEQVRDLKKTIPLATTFSLVIITITYISLSLAIQSFKYTSELSLVNVLSPLFGNFSVTFLALLVSGLCIFTYLLIVGALARLVNSLSVEGYLPRIFTKKNKDDIPVNSVLYFITVHLVVLLLVNLKILSLELILSIANGFFLANALIGLIASLKVIDGLVYKAGGIILSISLFILLSFSSKSIFIAMIFVYFMAGYLEKKNFIAIESCEV